MLSVNLHDRVSNSLDLLSMLSDCLVAMLGGYAMRVDRPREILKGVNILLDFRKDMLPFNIINRTVHLFQLIHILDDLRKFMISQEALGILFFWRRMGALRRIFSLLMAIRGCDQLAEQLCYSSPRNSWALLTER